MLYIPYFYQETEDMLTLVTKHKCPPLYDANGCPALIQCVESESQCHEQTFDARGCRVLKSPSCTEETEKECETLYQANGCPEEPFCLAKDLMCPKQIYDSQGCPTDMPDPECDLATEIKCEAGEFQLVIFNFLYVGSGCCFSIG